MRKMKLNKLIMIFALVFASGALFAACGTGGNTTASADESADSTGAEAEAEAEPEPEPEPAPAADAGTDFPVVEMIIEDFGNIEVELDPLAAPISVENFMGLVDEGFYDGLTFHRIIPDFMIQGGDPSGTGAGPGTANIKGEFASNGWDNPLSFTKGTIGMARRDDPNSASCQFFITNTDATFLDPNYAAFGRVLSGIDVVDAISAVPTDPGNRPDTPVVIETIKRK